MQEINLIKNGFNYIYFNTFEYEKVSVLITKSIEIFPRPRNAAVN